MVRIAEQSKTPLKKGQTVFIVWDTKEHFDEWSRYQSATPEEKQNLKLKDVTILVADSNKVPAESFLAKDETKSLKKEDVCLLVGAIADGDNHSITGMKCFFCTAVQTQEK